MKYKYALSAVLLLAAFSSSAQDFNVDHGGQKYRPPPASSITNSKVISNWVTPKADLTPYATMNSLRDVAQASRQMNFGKTQPAFRQAGDNALRYFYFCYAPGAPVDGEGVGCTDGGGATVTGTVIEANPSGGGSDGGDGGGGD